MLRYVRMNGEKVHPTLALMRLKPFLKAQYDCADVFNRNIYFQSILTSQKLVRKCTRMYCNRLTKQVLFIYGIFLDEIFFIERWEKIWNILNDSTYDVSELFSLMIKLTYVNIYIHIWNVILRLLSY